MNQTRASMPPKNDPSLIVELADLEATERLAAHLASLTQAGDVIGLEGPLGVGKTAFARGFITALLGPLEVPSPTFTLVQLYERAAAAIWHFDLYRLTRPEEVDELGLDDALAGGIALIEWPERLGDRAPPDRLILKLEPGQTPGARRARLFAHGPRAGVLLDRLREVLP
ncbi:MAG: tRNA (adenosine(37)-N6)-threonylcarbamoyltransferase complex ATPase subunit type 1 TsaE [Alphaproteobacteria bacterium]|nr:tRNA (adenosine(37)-N6)-threonylcarbamoyltransferase complex ATPase subunit type 1 TsaE [Alphaproteobacteria bacterium]